MRNSDATRRFSAWKSLTPFESPPSHPFIFPAPLQCHLSAPKLIAYYNIFDHNFYFLSELIILINARCNSKKCRIGEHDDRISDQDDKIAELDAQFKAWKKTQEGTDSSVLKKTWRASFSGSWRDAKFWKKVCIYSFTKCKVSTEMEWKSAKSILPKCEISILEKSPSEIVRSRQWSQNLNFDCGILFFYQKSDSESLKTIFPSSARISYRDPKIRIQRCRFSS